MTKAVGRATFIALLCSVIWTAGGCATALSSGSQSEACAEPVETTRHELYFGLQRPDGSVIRAEEFETFLDEVVEPHFPEGLTVIDAAGKYRTADGSILDEATKLLVLVYPDSDEVRGRIRSVIAQYCTRFDQESVGWVRTAVRACF